MKKKHKKKKRKKKVHPLNFLIGVNLDFTFKMPDGSSCECEAFVKRLWVHPKERGTLEVCATGKDVKWISSRSLIN